MEVMTRVWPSRKRRAPRDLKSGRRRMGWAGWEERALWYLSWAIECQSCVVVWYEGYEDEIGRKRRDSHPIPKDP